MMEDIINSKLTPAEKLFLIAEWILRDYLPYELQSVKLSDIQAKVTTFVEKRLPSGFLENALTEAKSILHTKNHARVLPLIIGLAYYSYIDSEVVHEHEKRLEMMSTVSQLGFKLSEIEEFHETWTQTVGDSATLFNKIFKK